MRKCWTAAGFPPLSSQSQLWAGALPIYYLASEVLVAVVACHCYNLLELYFLFLTKTFCFCKVILHWQESKEDKTLIVISGRTQYNHSCNVNTEDRAWYIVKPGEFLNNSLLCSQLVRFLLIVLRFLSSR